MTEKPQNSPDRCLQLERRCPRLGGPVSFGYCLEDAAAQGPCWKTLDCWWEYFDVAEYLRRRLGDGAVVKLAEARPKPKVLSLLEQIERAQQRCRDDR